MRNLELLMPAGNLEKLEYAIRYGADAVYLGVVDFSLRAMRKGSLITMDNLKEAVDLAHKLGVKAYVTINIFAFNNDIKLLETCMDRFKDANPDAFIISDYGIFNMIRKHIPQVPIHVSTQTNTLNYESVKFWRDLGATRVILARELPIADIAEIRKNVPDIELECFVQGAQCVSFSGRCLLSDYFSKGERKANHGNCSQPCRWSYRLVEETRPNEFLEINQDERGSHILSPKDLCLVKQLPQLIDAGIDSFKVEGRTKSLYYVSAVAKAYRHAIDDVLKNRNADLEKYFIELQKVGNRGYTTGFALGDNNGDSYSYDISKGLAGADFLCEFREHSEQNSCHSEAIAEESRGDYHLVKIKNKMHVGDEVEIITPEEQFVAKVEAVKNVDGENLELGNTNDDVYVKFSQTPKDTKYALVRTIGVKNYHNL